MPARFEFAVAHLALRLRPLHRALRAAVDRQTEFASRLTRPDLTPFCVTAEQAGALLDRADRLTGPAILLDDRADGFPTTDAEYHAERELRREAAAAGRHLPLDELSARFRLSRVEQDALLL